MLPPLSELPDRCPATHPVYGVRCERMGECDAMMPGSDHMGIVRGFNWEAYFRAGLHLWRSRWVRWSARMGEKAA